MDAQMSTLVAAVAGVLGIAIGGLLTGRHQRSSQLRGPMLDVALDYVEALREALPDTPNEPRQPTPTAQAQLARAYRLSHRVVLIFGPDTAAGEQAIEAYFETLTAFDQAKRPLDIEDRITDGEATAKEIWRHEHERAEFKAERAVDRFAVVAGRAIRSGGRHPWLERGRRVRQQILSPPKSRRIMRKLRSVSARLDANAEALKQNDKELRRALDEAEAQGIPMPIDLNELEVGSDD